MSASKFGSALNDLLEISFLRHVGHSLFLEERQQGEGVGEGVGEGGGGGIDIIQIMVLLVANM